MADMAPSERELEILKVLWEAGEGSVRDVQQRLAPKRELHFNTVQTLLRIMEEKGLVRHRAVGRTFIYSPNHSREQVTRLQRTLAGDVFVNAKFSRKIRAGEPQVVLEITRYLHPGANKVLFAATKRADAALKSASPVLANPANYGRAVALTFEQFKFGWTNALSEDESKILYETHHVAGSGRPDARDR